MEARGRIRGTPGVSNASAPAVRVGVARSEQTDAENARAAADSEHTNKGSAQVEPASRQADGRVGPPAAPQAAGLGPRALRGWTPGQRTQNAESGVACTTRCSRERLRGLVVRVEAPSGQGGAARGGAST